MPKKIIILSIVSILLIGCSSTPKRSTLIKSTSNFNLNKLKGEKELFAVFSKNTEGSPTSLVDITSNQVKALKYFKDNSFIKKNDCIRITENGATVCNQKKWFAYGFKDKTTLTTREAKAIKDPISSIIATPAIIAFSIIEAPFALLAFKNPITAVTDSLTVGFTDPVQDIDELKYVKNEILNLANIEYLKEKSRAMTRFNSALYFFKQYPKDNFSKIIDSNILVAKKNKNHKDIFKIATKLPIRTEQKKEAIEILRSFNSFNGFSTAFDLSSSVYDAKKAQKFANSSNDKQKVEYMGLKIFKSKNSSLTNMFKIDIKGMKEGSISTKKLDSSFLSFSVNREAGQTRYSFPIKLAAKKSLGLEYGVYDVHVKLTLKVPVRYYRRSKWVGNADENKIDKYTQEEVLRIRKNNFSTNATITFDDVTTSYLDRGMMGGITEIVMNGDPSVKAEVTNVTIAE